MKLTDMEVRDVHWRVTHEIPDIAHPVLVITGPNEAGKSTLLHALAALASEQLFPKECDWTAHVRLDEIDVLRTCFSSQRVMVNGQKHGVRAGCKLIEDTLKTADLFDAGAFMAQSAKAQRAELREILESVGSQSVMVSVTPADAGRLSSLGVDLPRTREQALAAVDKLSSELSDVDSAARLALQHQRAAQANVDQATDRVRAANLAALDAQMTDLDAQRQTLRDALTVAKERQQQHEKAQENVALLEHSLKEAREQIPVVTKSIQDRQVALRGAQEEAEQAASRAKAARDAEEAARTDVADARTAVAEAEAALKGAEREQNALKDHARVLARAAAILEMLAPDQASLVSQLRQLGVIARGGVVRALSDAVVSARAYLQDMQIELRRAQESAREARTAQSATEKAVTTIQNQLTRAQDRLSLAEETAKRATDDLRQAKAALDDVEPPPIEPTELRLEAVKAKLDEVRRLRDRVNDHQQAEISLRKADQQRSQAVAKRDRLRAGLEAAENVLAAFLEAESRSLLDPANAILEPVTGYQLTLDMSGGTGEPFSLTRGQHVVPLSQGSDSQRVIAGVALAAAASSRCEGWRRIIVDRFEMVGKARRDALLEALAAFIEAGNLDNVVVAAVADGWTPKVGHHYDMEIT